LPRPASPFWPNGFGFLGVFGCPAGLAGCFAVFSGCFAVLAGCFAVLAGCFAIADGDAGRSAGVTTG